jgi:hypothetical protein
MDWLAFIVGGVAASPRHSPLAHAGGETCPHRLLALRPAKISSKAITGALGLSGPHGASG